MQIKFIKNKEGFIALTSVLIISAFFILLFSGMFFSASEQMERVDNREKAVKASMLANGCAEEALNSLRENIDYLGGETKTIGSYSCDILSLDRTETMRVIKAQATVGNFTKKIQVEADVQYHPDLKILDWREVTEFTNL